MDNKKSIFKSIFRSRRTYSDVDADAGFTLIELAIVTIIFGLGIIPIVLFFLNFDAQEQVKKDKMINERVMSALTLFLMQNGRYPCPSDLDLDINNPLFGEEATGAGGCNGTIVSERSGVAMGGLPVKTLNLPFTQAFNEYGWAYIYAVTESLTDAATYNGIGNVEVRAANGAGFTAITDLPYILVNTGVDGKGSFSSAGQASSLACDSLADDVENCDITVDAVFLDSQIGMAVNPSSAGYYDDTISYRRVSDKNDAWVIRQNTVAGRVEITNRELGQIGFGIIPQDKLHVDDDVIVEAQSGGNYDGGEVFSEGSVVVRDSLHTTNLVFNDPVNQNRVFAESFCMGEVGEDIGCCTNGKVGRDGDGDEFCCMAQVYDDLTDGIDGEICGNACTRDFLDRNGECCYSYNLTSGSPRECCMAPNYLDSTGACVVVP
jgi:prepilin-type N-terminal cleavage/methylation domain-containing protein